MSLDAFVLGSPFRSQLFPNHVNTLVSEQSRKFDGENDDGGFSDSPFRHIHAGFFPLAVPVCLQNFRSTGSANRNVLPSPGAISTPVAPQVSDDSVTDRQSGSCLLPRFHGLKEWNQKPAQNLGCPPVPVVRKVCYSCRFIGRFVPALPPGAVWQAIKSEVDLHERTGQAGAACRQPALHCPQAVVECMVFFERCDSLMHLVCRCRPLPRPPAVEPGLGFLPHCV